MARIATVLAVVAVLAAACGGGNGDEAPGTGERLTGRIEADGSSTVGPFTTRAAELFQQHEPGVEITVGVSGTGGGFERFCRGETDLSNASRPIKDEEKQLCRENGIDYLELPVANDALTVVVSTENDWVDCLTVAQLRALWRPGSTIENWRDVPGGGYPDERLALFGPGTDSGTFDYFTDAINGEEGASRSDYAASEDDNVIVTGVAGERGGLGYLGFSYFEENQDQLKALEVDGGAGCVAPTVASAQRGTYKPLSRPLFVYAKATALARPEVEAFVAYTLDSAARIAKEAKFVPLTTEQIAKARARFQATS